MFGHYRNSRPPCLVFYPRIEVNTNLPIEESCLGPRAERRKTGGRTNGLGHSGRSLTPLSAPTLGYGGRGKSVGKDRHKTANYISAVPLGLAGVCAEVGREFKGGLEMGHCESHPLSLSLAQLPSRPSHIPHPTSRIPHPASAAPSQPPRSPIPALRPPLTGPLSALWLFFEPRPAHE